MPCTPRLSADLGRPWTLWRGDPICPGDHFVRSCFFRVRNELNLPECTNRFPALGKARRGHLMQRLAYLVNDVSGGDEESNKRCANEKEKEK